VKIVPGESFFNERNPHLVRVDGASAPRQARVDTDWKVIVDVDVEPATESPEPTVKDAVVLRRTDTIRILRQDLHAAANTCAKAALTTTIVRQYNTIQ